MVNLADAAAVKVAIQANAINEVNLTLFCTLEQNSVLLLFNARELNITVHLFVNSIALTIIKLEVC